MIRISYCLSVLAVMLLRCWPERKTTKRWAIGPCLPATANRTCDFAVKTPICLDSASRFERSLRIRFALAAALWLSGCIEGHQDLSTELKQVFPFDPKELNGYINDNVRDAAPTLALARTDEGYWASDSFRKDRVPTRINLFETPGYQGWIMQSKSDGSEQYTYSYLTKSKDGLTLWLVTNKGKDQINNLLLLKQRVFTNGYVPEIAPQLSVRQTFKTLQDVTRLKIDLEPVLLYRPLDQAIVEYTAKIALNHNAWEKYLNRAVAYQAKGYYDVAIADFTTVIQQADRQAEGSKGVLQLAYGGRAAIYEAEGEFNLAIADFATVIQFERLDDGTPNSYKNPTPYFGRALAYQAKGDFDAAIADYNEVIDREKRANDAFYQRGLAYEAKGDLPHAISDFSEAILIDPGFAAALTSRGKAYEAMNDMLHARADFQAAVATPTKYASNKPAQDTARQRLAALAARPGTATSPSGELTLSQKPTFRCGSAKSSIARILCNEKEGPVADWELSAAIWALRNSFDEVSSNAFAQAQTQWFFSLYPKCALASEQATWRSKQADCVIGAFRARAREYQSRLRGDALVETQLSPEERSRLQAGLIALGFLDNEPDGEFGPVTRAAIRKFQNERGLPQTGYLSAEQRARLLASTPMTP